MSRPVQLDWRSARLGECCEIVSGATPRTELPEYWNGGIPWATPRDLSALNSPVLCETAKRITSAGYESCSTSLLPAGSVLFTSRAPVGLVAIAGQPMCTNQGFKSLIPGPSLDPAYLFWCVRAFAGAIERRGSGTTFTEVSKEVMSRFEIPLPPLPEQRRIAAMLDKADTVQRKQRERIRLLDELLRSAFLEMFGDPVKHSSIRDMPAGWRLLTVESIAAPTLNACAGGPFGSSLIRADYVAIAGVPVIRGSNLMSERAVFREEGFVFVTDEKAEELRRNVALPGDVIFTQRGTLGQIARIPLNAKYQRYIISQSQMKVTLDETVVDPAYFVHYFLSPRARMDLEARTLATGVPHINLSILKRFLVVLPPLVLQRRFAALASQLSTCRQHMESASSQAERLASSLTQAAFGRNPDASLTF